MGAEPERPALRIVTPSSPRIAVVGLGTMGRAIARTLSTHGFDVRGYDPSGARADAGAVTCTTFQDCVEEADLVFEAVPEDLAVKEAVLRKISGSTVGIIASNTSTFMPRVLAEFVDRPERLLVAHFFNPADVVPLVELVPHRGTAADATDAVARVLRAAGKKVVRLDKEQIGFVANRLQAAILRESLHLIDEGVVSAADLDEVVRSSLAPRWSIAGPIGVADLGGLDVFAAVCAQIFPDLADDTQPSSSIRSHVDAGRLGAKSGEGFYRHTQAGTTAVLDRMTRLFADLDIDHGVGPIQQSGAGE